MVLQTNKSNRLKQNFFLLFCFSLPAFHVLHRYNEYFSMLSAKQAMIHFLIYTGSFLLVFFLSKKILGHPLKAASVTLLLMIIFFFFGPLHDGMKRMSLPAPVTSYGTMLPLILVTVLFFFLYIRKKKIFNAKYLYFFNLLFVVFFSFELGLLCVNILFKRGNINNYATNSYSLPSSITGVRDLPDIYFIVFDEYTSTPCLKEEFGFNNEGLDSLLKQYGFFISSKSNSNYNVTPFSVASTLNLNYLRDELAGKKMTAKLLLQGENTLKLSWLPVFLRRSGYLIKNCAWFDLQDYPSRDKTYFREIRDEVNSEPTLFGSVKRDIGWNILKFPFFSSALGLEQSYFQKNIHHINNNKYFFESLQKELKSSGAAPKFVYCHLMLPHEPFLLDKNGNMLNDSLKKDQVMNSKKLYLEQLQYVNLLIKQLLPDITHYTGRPRAVILEGDHGFKFEAQLNNLTSMFKNLNAYYFSDHNYQGLYDSISPVNSFRIVLNKYFGQHLNVLPDRTVFINMIKDSASLIPE